MEQDLGQVYGIQDLTSTQAGSVGTWVLVRGNMNAGSRPLFSDPANLFKVNSFQASYPIWASEASRVSRYPPNGELVRRLTSELQFVLIYSILFI